MSPEPVLPCVFDAAFECRFAGEAVPPDGRAMVEDSTRRCPRGYLPHRKSEPVALQGKRVITTKPAERGPV